MEIRPNQTPLVQTNRQAFTGQAANTWQKLQAAYLQPASAPRVQGATGSLQQSFSTAQIPQQNRFESIRSMYQQISSLANSQRAMDQEAGRGLIQGLSAFDQRMYQAQYAQRTAAAIGPQPEPPSTLDSVGAYAQQYQLGQIRNELLLYGAEQLGYTPEMFSELGAAGLEYFGIAPNSAAAEGAAATAGALEGGAQVASNILSAAGAAYSGYQMIDSWGQSTPEAGAMQGAAMGAYIGSSVLPGVGTAVGALFGAALGGVAGSISSGKHPDQKARDAVRDFFQEKGLINDDYQLTLADGSLYDIGIDGRNKYENLDGTNRAPYQVDTSNLLSGQAVGWLDPLTEILVGGNEKLRADFVGYFTNAVTANAQTEADVYKNVLGLYAQVGIEPQAIAQGLIQLHQSEKIDSSRLESYLHSLTTLLNPSMVSPQLMQGTEGSAVSA